MTSPKRIMALETKLYRVIRAEFERHVEQGHGGDKDSLIQHELEFAARAGEVFRQLTVEVLEIASTGERGEQ